VSKDGFQTVTQKVDIATNENRSFSPKLSAVGSTTVVITTTVPVVDLTTTTTGMNVSMESVASVPKGRDFTTMAFFAPGVTSSGFGDPSFSGASGAENSYVVDGLTTTDFRAGFQGASLKTDFIDQVEIQTGGFKPEYSALGGVFNAVTKSGSNDMKGSAWLTWDAVGIHAAQKIGQYFRESSPESRYDIGAELGGAFIKDKLFYYFGVDGNFQDISAGEPNAIGLRNSDGKDNTIQAIGKINWYITQDMQLTGVVNYNDQKVDQDHAYTFIGTADFGASFKDKTLGLALNFDWTITPALLLSVKAGYTDSKQTNDVTSSLPFASDSAWFNVGPGRAGGPDPSAGTQAPGVAYRTGGFGYNVNDSQGKTTQFSADLSWFLGAHNLKFGLSWIKSEYSYLAGDTGTSDATHGGTAIAATDGLGFHRWAMSASGNTLYMYTQHTNASVDAEFTGLYAQDQWEMFSGFRLMYGLRYEIQDQKDLTGKSFLKYDKFQDVAQPRIGFTWDINNDGKSKLSGSYATYFEKIPQRLAIRVFANETYTRKSYSSPASGLGNATYDRNTGAYAVVNPGNYGTLIDYATPFSFDPIALNTKLPQRQEYTLGFDQTLGNGWTAGIHGKYRKLKNPIEDMVITDSHGNPYDEGPSIAFDAAGNPLFGVGAAILGNPGQFQEWHPRKVLNADGSINFAQSSMTYYWLDPANNGGNPNNAYNDYGKHIYSYYDPARDVFSINGTGYDNGAGNNYYSVDFTLDKRTDRDYVAFSYTWSRLEGNYEGVVSSSNGQADGNITASFDYYPYVGYGLLPLDRTHQIKLQASHRFTVAGNDLNWGAAWTYLSGTPVSLFDDGSTTNGDAPGWDTAHNYGGQVITTANYNNPGNWTGGVIPTDGSNTGYTGAAATAAGISPYNTFYDIGGYGNATPANGTLGQYGRTPSTNQVDMHLDYVIKFGRMSLAPMVDVFNLFNTRYATGVLQQGTDGVGNPDLRYGAPTSWQEGRHYRFGVKFRF
ncbi:MAG TPA: TonB-dependent receptor, partial [Holophagaceae bacterium]|nr:TonB-dependent receptor [Holophagaceae bacterium]